MNATNNEHPTHTPSHGGAITEEPRKTDAGPSKSGPDRVHGEGDYKAAREFNEAERKFVASGKVAAAALAAAPKSEAELQEMFAAEQEGIRRAKGEDSALTKSTPGSSTLRLPRKDTDQKRR